MTTVRCGDIPVPRRAALRRQCDRFARGSKYDGGDEDEEEEEGEEEEENEKKKENEYNENEFEKEITCTKTPNTNPNIPNTAIQFPYFPEIIPRHTNTHTHLTMLPKKTNKPNPSKAYSLLPPLSPCRMASLNQRLWSRRNKRVEEQVEEEVEVEVE
ncbi:hypothetical protein IAQ61_007152 [Plenodomus lingam]|uniref:uncharacterized protein n=1 Tax=Leptosphaeria maculans TaxID=5022 RepID=UPI003329F886|nr:hypothetical protein IAQ61_007152 [Plenodomus lingam]